MSDLRETIQASQDSLGGTFLIRRHGKEEDWIKTIEQVRVPRDPYTPISYEFEMGVPLKDAAGFGISPKIGHPTWQRRAIHGLVAYDLFTIQEMVLEFADVERKAWGVCEWQKADDSCQRPDDAPADLSPKLFPFWDQCLQTEHAGMQRLRMVKKTYPPAPDYLMPWAFYLPHSTLLRRVVFVDAPKA